MSSSATNDPGSGGKEEQQQQPPAAARSKPIEALPAPGEGTSSSHPVLDVSSGGGTISLDAMGPIVVNRDGTISRVQNWSKMTEIEKENTLRVLGKRNQQRLATLRAENGQGEGSESKEQ
jgi:hypothetical protein